MESEDTYCVERPTADPHPQPDEASIRSSIIFFMSILVLICYLGFQIIPFYIFQPKPGINLPYRCLLHACPSHYPSFVKSNYIW